MARSAHVWRRRAIVCPLSVSRQGLARSGCIDCGNGKIGAGLQQGRQTGAELRMRVFAALLVFDNAADGFERGPVRVESHRTSGLRGRK